MIREFLRRFEINATASIIIFQTVLAGLTALILLTFLRDEDDPVTIILTALGLGLAIEIVMAPIFVRVLGRPFRILAQAIMHVAKESSDTPPPNVNNPNDERSGLKSIVQTIYELVATIPTTPQGDVNFADASTFALPLLEKLPVGILVFNRQEQLVYANQLSTELFSAFSEANAVHNLQDVHLFFPEYDSLATWLTKCRQDKIQDMRLWQRVGSKPLSEGEEDRKLFDVIAHYNKHESHQIETILIVIDRTQEYVGDEEAMDFIALAAHELRGPITIIRGYLDVLEQELDQKISADERMMMERLLVSAAQLSGYINNILNVARFDRNHLQLHLREENWAQLMLASYLPDLEMRARAHNRHLTVKIPDNLPTVAADGISLQEVVTNLVDNAIKYSKDGGEIIITAYLDGDFVETTVQDFGIGIPESVVPRLFTKFYRSHRSRQQVTGTGLGLYLCKAIMESHGGSIWVRSAEGEGSVFGFRLPTYASVATTMQKDDNSNEAMIIKGSHGWIKNHSYYRR
ncbi:MAG TPA: HAMP domain-containing sensor histidine kinase [Candidatus Saccharimonadales bacterium]|nr:HAMP domain-containing sensor histidine kinase [Candidatus Saccharimonadales bacterium]